MGIWAEFSFQNDQLIFISIDSPPKNLSLCIDRSECRVLVETLDDTLAHNHGMMRKLNFREIKGDHHDLLRWADNTGNIGLFIIDDVDHRAACFPVLSLIREALQVS